VGWLTGAGVAPVTEVERVASKGAIGVDASTGAMELTADIVANQAINASYPLLIIIINCRFWLRVLAGYMLALCNPA